MTPNLGTSAGMSVLLYGETPAEAAGGGTAAVQVDPIDAKTVTVAVRMARRSDIPSWNFASLLASVHETGIYACKAA